MRFESALPGRLPISPLTKNCVRAVEVQLGDTGFEPGSLHCLPNLPDVRRLYLQRSDVTDEDLRYVGQLEKLERLSLWRTEITSDGLANLGGLTELRVLDIHACRDVDESALENLTCWPDLRCLIQDLQVGEQGLAALAKHPHIPVESLHVTGVTDRCMADLIRLRRLKWLTVGLECDRSRARELAQLRQLQHLDLLGRFDISTDGLQQAMPQLQSVEQHRLTSRTFKQLADRFGASCDGLEMCATYPWETDQFDRDPISVNIRRLKPDLEIAAEVKTVTWDDVRKFRNASAVTIEGHGFDSSNLSHLQQLPKLKELHLRVGLDERAMQMIGRLRTLQHLNLSSVKVTRSEFDPESCQALAALSDLRTLTLVLTRTDDRHLAFLGKCKKLRRVHLHDVWISGETIARMKELPELEELLIFNCHRLRPADVQQIRDFKQLRTCWMEDHNGGPLVSHEILATLPLLENERSRRSRLRPSAGSHVFRALPPLPKK